MSSVYDRFSHLMFLGAVLFLFLESYLKSKRSERVAYLWQVEGWPHWVIVEVLVVLCLLQWSLKGNIVFWWKSYIPCKRPWNSLFVTHLLCHVVVFLAVKSRKTTMDTGKSKVFDTGGVGSGGRLSMLPPRPSADAGMGLGLKLWALIPALLHVTCAQSLPN